MKTIQISSSIRQIIGLVVMVMCALGALSAHAASTNLTFVSSPSLYEAELLKYGNYQRNTNTGAYEVKTGATGTPFWVYCLDPLTYFQTTNSYNSTDLSTFVSGGSYASLFATSAYQTSGSSGVTGTGVTNKYDDSNTTTSVVLAKLQDLYSHAYVDSLTSLDKSAAFQYAIWEIEGDSSSGGYTSTSGGLQYVGASNNFLTQVNVYLKALNTATGTGSWASIGLGAASSFIYTVYSSTTLGASQTVMTVTPNGTVNANNAVPEPASYMLLGIGLFALGASRRGNRRLVFAAA